MSAESFSAEVANNQPSDKFARAETAPIIESAILTDHLETFFVAENLNIEQFEQTRPLFTQATARFLRQNLDAANAQAPYSEQRAALPRGLVRNCLARLYNETTAMETSRQKFTQFVGEAYVRRLRFVEIQQAINLSDRLPHDYFLQPCISDLMIGYGMAATQVRHGR